MTMTSEADDSTNADPPPDDGPPPKPDGSARRIGADRLAELEEERRFLLRSLADLTREHQAGDVDDADFAALRDGYTARAATVLRAIDAGRAALAPRRPGRLKRIVAIALAVVLVGAGLGYLVAHYVSPRGSGDTITGGLPQDQVASLLAAGRSQLDGGDYAGAIASYRAVLKLQPDNAEAYTYLGWNLAVISQSQAESDAGSALAAAKDSIRKAIAIDSSYADPYCFLSLIAGLFEKDLPNAFSLEQQCLDRNPVQALKFLLQFNIDPLKPGSATTSTASPTSPPPTVA